MELDLGDMEGKNSYCHAQHEVGPRSRWKNIQIWNLQADQTKRGRREKGLGSNKYLCHCLGKDETIH